MLENNRKNELLSKNTKKKKNGYVSKSNGIILYKVQKIVTYFNSYCIGIRYDKKKYKNHVYDSREHVTNKIIHEYKFDQSKGHKKTIIR